MYKAQFGKAISRRVLSRVAVSVAAAAAFILGVGGAPAHASETLVVALDCSTAQDQYVFADVGDTLVMQLSGTNCGYFWNVSWPQFPDGDDEAGYLAFVSQTGGTYFPKDQFAADWYVNRVG